jgi:tight adherence protein C
VKSFAAAIIQADQLGTPIANVLRIQSEQMRVLRSQRAREQANTTPVKIIFPLVLFIFPAMFVIILGPAMIRVFAGGIF